MGRPVGSRSPEFAAKREALARRVLDHLIATGDPDISARSLAAACGVTPPTLVHYFGGRVGALKAAFEAAGRAGKEHLAFTIGADLGDVRTSLLTVLRYLVDGWEQYGVGTLNAVGLGAGLGEASLGPVYIEQMLEPTLQGFEARLARHVATGELVAADLRLAALQLVGPLILALLHQHQLGGRACRPLDVPTLIEAQVDAFLRLYGQDA